MDAAQYHHNKPIALVNRLWASKTLQQAPKWCSVDLCDGNYTLDTPLVTYRRDFMLGLLLQLGFQDIALGHISSSKGKMAYLNQLLESDSIPAKTCIELDTTAKEEAIIQTLQSIQTCKNARVRLCIPTSVRFRELILKCDKKQLIDQATLAAQSIKEHNQHCNDASIQYGFCLEDFSATELPFAVDICHAILEIWQPTIANPVVISLPISTDQATPNYYADQIEWFCQHIQSLNTLVISLYAANDRGTAVAAIELGLLAGGQRIEGSLFGNGERSGCAPIITLALNMLAQGIDPRLVLNNIDEIIEIVQAYTQQRLSSGQPYSGDRFFTTLDEQQRHAIKTGLTHFATTKKWDVPYATIDPTIIGRSFNFSSNITKLEQQYDPSSILEEIYGFHLPKTMRASFNRVVEDILGESIQEASPKKIKQIFYQSYIDNNFPFVLKNINFSKKALYGDADETQCEATITHKNDIYQIHGTGNGPIDTLIEALKTHLELKFDVAGYAQHALMPQGSSGLAVTYIRVIDKDSTNGCWGVGIDSEGTLSSIKALINALNRSYILNNWVFYPGETS
ncbi:2-isopropylmalate synthase [soil metagenome]